MSNAREISCYDLLDILLNKETLHDIQLEGTDGVRVGASRAVLAAKSVVFEKMLFGSFAETSRPVLKLAYKGVVVEALVEYIHKDECEILEKIKQEKADDATSEDTLTHPRTLVSLTAAAVYYNFPGLCEQVYEWLRHHFEVCPVLAFAILDACEREGPSAPSRLSALALSGVRSNARYLQEEDATIIATLSPSTMEAILKDYGVQTAESQLFKILEMWVDGGDASFNRTPSSQERKKTIASELVKNIRLEWIDPMRLSTSVAASGFVPLEQLAEAYKSQALLAKLGHGIKFNKKRRCAIP